jgi:hypothetical protein
MAVESWIRLASVRTRVEEIIGGELDLGTNGTER